MSNNYSYPNQYHVQPGQPGYIPPQGYPEGAQGYCGGPPNGFPMSRIQPGQPGYIPPQGYPEGAQGFCGGPPNYPSHPSSAGYPQHQTTDIGSGLAPPPAPFANSWYASYFNQVNPQQLQQIQAWFHSVDKDRSGNICARELSSMTYPGRNDTIGPTLASKAVDLFDKDKSGSIDIYEYGAFFGFLYQLQCAFYENDRDKSGFLDSREVWSALDRVGFKLEYKAVDAWFKKYTKLTKSGFDKSAKSGLNMNDFFFMVMDMALVKDKIQRLGKKDTVTGKTTVDFDAVFQIVASSK